PFLFRDLHSVVVWNFGMPLQFPEQFGALSSAQDRKLLVEAYRPNSLFVDHEFVFIHSDPFSPEIGTGCYAGTTKSLGN
ncbi:hypothetical protein, partial [Parendozoicomonas sp. Alg238-R29]|uniref:hypothetical protein n=1 Tax=Parendozoicomonas sp. Alg238-R29 TaxID=2993446 RepID=UPI00248E2CBE